MSEVKFNGVEIFDDEFKALVKVSIAAAFLQELQNPEPALHELASENSRIIALVQRKLYNLLAGVTNEVREELEKALVPEL